jgi:hypothetical protein
MTTRGAWIRDATETDALEGGTAHHAIALEPRVDRETPRVGGGRHGAFVCVRARESVGEALGRAERDNDSRKHLREFRLNFVPFANQKRRRCRIVTFFAHSRARRNSSSRVFSRVASRYKASRSPAVLPPSSRVAPPRARRVACPRHARGPKPVIARGRGVSSALRRGLLETDVFFQTRDARASSSRGASERAGRLLRSKGRRGNLVSSSYRV